MYLYHTHKHTNMIRNIILVRHAKSDWQHGVTADHQRPLNVRGKRDIPIMTSVLIQNYPEIDIALSSDSERTAETIQGINKYGFVLPEIIFSPNLYQASMDKFETELATLSDDIISVMICAHNPGVSDLVQKICNLDFIEIPTLGIAWVETDLDTWSNIFTAKGNLVRYDYPKKK